ncbi:XVIPCD domain-containing protein [Luteimonas aquatica]|uniref:XVIPCD domain-containing protein n=1 Tax=Luteimonas aquatica TaxID=450364 RepID=UPI001F5ADAF7|nr:XVIPCD domain-containing protein [Luteimonas aquatica]
MADAASTAISPDRARADQDYQDFLRAQPINGLLKLMEVHTNEPEYLAQLVQRAYADGKLEGVADPFNKTPAGEYGVMYSDKQRSVVLKALGAAMEHPWEGPAPFTDAVVRDLALKDPKWKSLGEDLNIQSMGRTPESDGAKAGLQDVQKDFDKANAAAEQRSERLMKGAQAFFPALDKDQQEKYVEAFRKDPANVEDYKRSAETGEKLARHLKDNRSELFDAAVRDPEARQQLYDSMKSLANNGQGVAAVEMLTEIRKDPNSPIARAFQGFDKIDEDITGPAAVSAAGQLLAKNAPDSGKAEAEFKELMEPYLTAYKAYGAGKKVQSAWENYQAGSAGDFDKLGKLGAKFDKVLGTAEASAMDRGMAAAGIVFGAYKVQAGIQKGLGSDDYFEKVKELAGGSKGGLEIVAGATKGLANAGMAGQGAVKSAEFLTRLTPALGAVAAGASAGINFRKGIDGGNAGYLVAAAGDVANSVGSAMATFPATAPAGELVAAGGAAVSLGGQYFGDKLDEAELRREAGKLLEAAGVTDPKVKQGLLGADRLAIDGMLRVGLRPEQIQELAKDAPDLLRDQAWSNYALPGVNRHGIEGERLFGMLKAAVGNGGNNEGAEAVMRTLTGALTFDGKSIGSDQDLIAKLQGAKGGIANAGNDGAVQGLDAAANWLAANPAKAQAADPLLDQARQRIGALGAQSGGYANHEDAERAAAQLALGARQNGMSRIDEVVLGQDGKNLIAVQRNPGNEHDTIRAHVNREQAATVPLEQSQRQLSAETERQSQDEQTRRTAETQAQNAAVAVK